MVELTRPAGGEASTDRSKTMSQGKMSDTTTPIVNKVQEIAEKRGISMAQVALAWSLSKPFVSAPIVGTTSLDKLSDLIAGCDVELSADEIKSIDELYKTVPVAGHA
jgi:aryl-alcohol dehydrogenase-like predicted oxidoreductase